MTTTTRPRTVPAAPMSAHRKTALTVGVLFLLTYLTSISAKIGFYPPFFDNADYIVSGGDETRVLWGAYAEVFLIITNIGSAVVLYPVLKRRFPVLSLGFVTARVVESVFIAVGVLAVLTLVTLSQDGGAAGEAGDATFLPVGDALIALHSWTFQLGPGFIVGIGNGLMLGYMFYRTGLVPRGMAVLGLVGGTLICLQGTAVIFGVIEPNSAAQLLASVPEFFWELSLGIYLVVKGFKPAPMLDELTS